VVLTGARLGTQMASTALLAALSAASAGHFNLSNTLGDTMVLQREPQQAVVWGFGDAGVSVTTTFMGKQLPAAKVDATGTWRVSLPATAASKVPTTITFAGSDGGSASLKDVLFGDVFLCSGQSNMQYTPHSMAGMNNLTAELAAADSYSDSVRFFTVGQDTHCGDPKKGGVDCTKPFAQLNANIPGGNNITGTRPCRSGQSCRETWEPASSRSLGGNGSAWNTFSAVCWLTFRDVHDALGGDVPMGLISNNWGGTPVQVWMPLSATKECSPQATVGGTLYNSMVAPYTVGPMALKGATWYQGESNVGQASFYSCGFPAMIKAWRELFKVPDLWFGFVQIANFRYSVPVSHFSPAALASILAAGPLPTTRPDASPGGQEAPPCL
jgi:sialate O-acetylesterase